MYSCHHYGIAVVILHRPPEKQNKTNGSTRKGGIREETVGPHEKSKQWVKD